MTPELFADVSRNLASHEDRVLSMYLDSVGVVTCGVGHALFVPGDAFNICWWKDTATLANREEVKAAWSGVKYKTMRRALLMSYEETDRLLQADLVRFERIVRSIFPDVDTYPHTVQVALYDLTFNCGDLRPNPERNHKGWPNFIKAVYERNWPLAATHSNRPQVGKTRNEDTFNQLNVV